MEPPRREKPILFLFRRWYPGSGRLGHLPPNFSRAPPTPVAVTLQTSVARCHLRSRPWPGPSPAPYYLSAPPLAPKQCCSRRPRRPRGRAGAAERISNTSAKRNPAKLDGFPGERVGSRVRIGPKRKCATYASAKRGLHARGFRAGNRSFQRAPRRGLKRILSAPMNEHFEVGSARLKFGA